MFGEDVDYICREMEAASLPLPEFKQDGFMFRATICKMVNAQQKKDGILNGTLNEKQQEVLNFIKNNPYVKAWEITSRGE